MNVGSDRSAALIAVAELDHALEDAILTKFTELEPNEHYELFRGLGAPLGTLGTKIRLGYALRIYGEITKSDLIKISNIRNAFAHSAMALNFSVDVIAAECRALNCLNEYSSRGMPGHDGGYALDKSTPRMIFLATTLSIVGALVAYELEEQKSVLARLEKFLEPVNQGKVSATQFNEIIRRLEGHAIP